MVFDELKKLSEIPIHKSSTEKIQKIRLRIRLFP